MPFKGTLTAGPYTVDVTPEVANVDSTALSFSTILKTDTLKSVDTLTVPRTQTSANRVATLGPNVVRLDIMVYPPADGLCQVRLTQGTQVITHDVSGDTALVFDVFTPPP